MRLATITNWAYGITVLLTLASGSTMLLASSAQERERVAMVQRADLDQATSTIDEDVAQLSSLARQFAISGSQADLIAYRRESGLLKAVETRTAAIRDAGATAPELRALHETLHWADALRGEQATAIEARARGNQQAALAILFSPEYERELDRIQSSVEHFQDRIDQRTAAAVDLAVSASRTWRRVSEIVLGLTGLVFLCVLFFVFRQRVLRPVVRLSDVVTRLAAQDYATEWPHYPQVDEIGDMAQALRGFRENGIVRQRLEKERDADRAVRDLLSRMTQRMQRCDSVADLTGVIDRFAPEVAPRLAGSFYLFDPERNVMQVAAHWLGPVRSRDEFVPMACWGLRRGRQHRPAGNHIDVPCDHVVQDGDTLVDSICLPLIGQNGILGLLYFERRGDTAEIGPDENYLKMLAENVGLALDNLRLRDALRALAMVDPLTGLSNRRQLDDAFEASLAVATRTNTPVSCAMIDVDHFKRFNDKHGHDAGDAVLRAVGEALKRSIRSEDLAFRYGGEEFLLLMPGLGVADARVRAEDIRARIANLAVRHDDRDLGPVTASIGVASWPEQCAADRLVQAADAALLRAKRGGRDQVATVVARDT
ncbi:diguanylate cyclase [Sphingomonas sp. NFR15]|uniref:diguanylate cyclase n=1 Tax=Sphingomonas sp. NFR15 TaxID=1566282 RepID=UPI000888C73E|nr:diguanylate cyclase [Sphingomonas sp. NFR15]SDA35536.1 diguanylate cyclase (GGDEF) domain-containing protein [Sphingomonas sp. NFR15]